MERLGELAAFGTALCWTASAIFFENASRRVGALAVNFYKVLAAFLFLGLAGLLLRGMPLPLDAPGRAWAWLSLSGLVGFVIADHFLFNAYVLIGSRITVVFQALTPAFTAGLGFLVLGERMRRESLVGMSLVVTGILCVVLSRNLGSPAGTAPSAPAAPEGKTPAEARAPTPGFHARGYVFAFLSSVFQATGLVLSKLGLGGYDAVSGTQIRVIAAIAGFAAVALLTGQGRRVFVQARGDGRAMRDTGIGAVFGPFLGVSFSLYALQATTAGTASTLMALTPVLIIVPSVLFLRQRVRLLEVAGAAVAVAGAALFFLL